MFTFKLKIIFGVIFAIICFLCGSLISYKFYSGDVFPEFLLKKKIETSFSEQITKIRATHGDILELAIINSTEIFEKKDSDPIGESKVRVSIPATFRFYIKISEPIEIKIIENADIILCKILAPKLRCATPIAFDTKAMIWDTDIALLHIHNKENLRRDLEEKISTRLRYSGENKIASGYVFPYAKKAFERFSQTWIEDIRLSIKKDKQIIFQINFENEPKMDSISIKESLDSKL